MKGTCVLCLDFMTRFPQLGDYCCPVCAMNQAKIPGVTIEPYDVNDIRSEGMESL